MSIKENFAGDKYCSENCFNVAGRKYLAWQSEGLSGNCLFCRKALQLKFFKPSMDINEMCLIFTWENSPMFVCSACARQGKQKAFFQSESKCCECGKEL